jgi:hypothetical protein
MDKMAENSNRLRVTVTMAPSAKYYYTRSKLIADIQTGNCAPTEFGSRDGYAILLE